VNYEEKTIASEKIFEGNVIRVKKDTVLLVNGKTATRELVTHPGGVAILPIDQNGNAYMVRQFRKPLENELLEVPAGKLNYGEDHYECAVRELKEETGFEAGKLIYLGYAFLSPGFCDEKIHLYLALDLKKGEMHLDEDEFLSLEKYQYDELLNSIYKGEIYDAKSIICLLRAKQILDESKE